MTNINRIELLFQVLIGVILIAILMFIVYFFTSPWGNKILYGNENFQNQILKKNPKKPTNEQKNLIIQYYTLCVIILVHDFNIELSNFNINFFNEKNGKDEIFTPIINITQNTPLCMTKNCTRFRNNMTFDHIHEMIHKLGFYKMSRSFFKELDSKNKNDKLELYDTPGIFDRYDISNQRNITQWGYLPTLIDKYLRLYTLFPEDLDGVLEDNSSNENQNTSGEIGIEPIEIPNDINIKEVLTIDEILDKNGEHSIFEIKRNLEFLKCALITKMDNIFDETMNCDTLKVNLINKVFTLDNDSMVLKRN
jgi:hypothetical protein